MILQFHIDTDKTNDIQLATLRRTIERARHAHFIEIKMRINGEFEEWQADWLKHLTEDQVIHTMKERYDP